MIESTKTLINNITSNFNPWTNVYGLARSLMGLSLLLTLSLNDVQTIFRPSSGADQITKDNMFSLFTLVPQEYLYLNIVRYIFIIILIFVVIGYRPRFTGILHFYIAYSLNGAGITIDGGEQVNTVLSLLMIPITLTDSRKWHWGEVDKNTLLNKDIAKIITFVSYCAIRLQIAILYFHSTVAKLGNKEWVDGTAVYYYMQDKMLGLPHFIYSIFSPIFNSWLIVIPTWGTLFIQIILFSALFINKKYWNKILIFALLFHELIAIMLGLISFSIVMIGALILYLKPLENRFKFKKIKAFSYKKIFLGGY